MFKILNQQTTIMALFSIPLALTGFPDGLCQTTIKILKTKKRCLQNFNFY